MHHAAKVCSAADYTPFSSLGLVSRKYAAVCVLCLVLNTSRMVQNWQTSASDFVVGMFMQQCVWVSHDLSLHVCILTGPHL